MPLPCPVNFQVLCDDCLEAERELHGGRDPEGLRPFKARPLVRLERSIRQRAVDLLGDGTPRTAAAIAECIGSDPTSVRSVLRSQRQTFSVVDFCWVPSGHDGKTERRMQIWALKPVRGG